MTVERRMLMASAGKTYKVSTTGPVADDPNSYWYSYSLAANPVNGNFLVVGYDYGTYDGICGRSVDQGVTFSNPIVVYPYSYIYSAACGNNGKWIAVGQNGNDGGNWASAWTSTNDGLTWTNKTRLDNFGAATSNAWAVGTDGNGTWIVALTSGTSGGGVFSPYYVKSTDDGATWSTPARFNGYTSSAYFQRIFYINGTWIVSGVTFTGGTPLITTSTDGTTWTTPSTTLNMLIVGTNEFNSGVYGNIAYRTSDYLCIAGSGATTVEYSKSTNRTTWSANANPPSGTTAGNGTAQYNPVTGNYVLVGCQNSPRTPVYWVSKDGGTTWGAKTLMYSGSPTTTYFYGISAINKYGRIVWFTRYWGYGSILNA